MKPPPHTAVFLRHLTVLLALLAAVPCAAQSGPPANEPPHASGPVVMPPPDRAPAIDTNATFQALPKAPNTGAPEEGLPIPPPSAITPSPHPFPNYRAPIGAPPSAGGPSSAGLPPGMGSASPGEQIDDIRPPFFFLRSWLWLWLTLASLALAALISFLWHRLSSRKGLNPRSAYELTLERLEQARALMNVDDPAPYAVAVSEAIRSYLALRFLTPSDRRTTEEFFRQMEADPHTPLAVHRDLLRDFLQSCDLLKFSRYQPTSDELEQVQQRAVTFVTATRPVPENAATPRAPVALMPQAS